MGPQHKRVYARLRRTMRGDDRLKLAASRCGGRAAPPRWTGDAGRYSRSFGLSASLASPPCGEWKAYRVTAAIARNSIQAHGTCSISVARSRMAPRADVQLFNLLKALGLQTTLTAHIEAIDDFGALTNQARTCSAPVVRSGFRSGLLSGDVLYLQTARNEDNTCRSRKFDLVVGLHQVSQIDSRLTILLTM